METNRQAWNERQKELRAALANPAMHARAIELFLEQHACLHLRRGAPGRAAAAWRFAEEVCAELPEPAWRFYAPQPGHSIAWMLWHSARIEDVTMNILLAGGEQVFARQGWAARLQVAARDTGNAMSPEQIEALSRAIDLQALLDYRDAVGRATREIVAQASPAQLKAKVDAARLERVRVEGAVPDAAREILDYWGGLTGAGLLLMPPTRHNFVHLNEALRLRQKLLR